MATAVCDTKPCDQMQQLLSRFQLHKSLAPTGHPQLFLSKVGVLSGSALSVKVQYCPFCGTRIVQGVFSKVPER